MPDEEKQTILKTLKISYGLLSKNERKKLKLLSAFILLCSFFEFFSVGSLFPYIKIISDPSIIYRSHKLSLMFHFFKFKNAYFFIIFLGVVIMFLILLKALLGLLNNYFQVKFSAQVKNRMGVALFENYLYLPIKELNELKSTYISKHILYDVNVYYTVVSAILNLITNSFMVFALISLMLFVSSFALTATLLILGSLMLIFIKMTRKKNQILGKENEKIMRYLYRHVDESLKGVKDIKAFCKEEYFLNYFIELQSIGIQQTVSTNVMANIPTVLINTLGFVIILGVVLSLLVINGSILNMLPTLGLIAISIQRLLPGLTLVTSSFGTIRIYTAVVFKLSELLKGFKNKDEVKITEDIPTLKFEKEITLEHIYFSYSNEQWVLQNINLMIKKNEILGIMGKSGSGKSTLIDVILGLYTTQKGRIFCDGVLVQQSLLKELKNGIAYIPQKPFIFDATLQRNITFGSLEESVNLDLLMQAIEISQLSDLVSDLPNGIDEFLGENAVKISGGQRQRIGLARAIYSNSDIIILDESTSALDLETEHNFYIALKNWARDKKTILIISHRDTLFSYCDRVLTVESGEIFESDTQVILPEIVDTI